MNKSLCWLLVIILSTLSGCAVGYTRVAKPPEVPLGNYRVIEIPNLEGGGQLPGGIKQDIPDKIAQELEEHRLFASVERSDEVTGQSVLLMKGRIIQYNPGSRTMRWLAGPLLGTGKGSVTVRVSFIDKDSRKVIAESSFEGEIRGGFFGGGIKETHSEISNEIVQFVKSNF